MGFFDDPQNAPRLKQEILEAHLRKFSITMAKEGSKVISAAVVGPGPTQRLGSALAHTIGTTLKLSIVVQPVWFASPKPGTDYAFIYSYRSETIGFVEQKHLSKLTDQAQFEKFPSTFGMSSLQTGVLRRLHKYEANPAPDGAGATGTQKDFLARLLALLDKAAKGAKTRRSSLPLDTKSVPGWFAADQPLHEYIKAKKHKGDADQQKLFAEVEFCRTNPVDFARKALCGLMLQYPDLLARFAARCVKIGAEEFRYYHHAQMVLNQFLDYFLDQDKPGSQIMCNELMIWMILFHDMDKVLSIETFGDDGEHDATVEVMKKYGDQYSGFTDPEIRLAWRMVSMDPLGEFFKGSHALLGGLEKKNKMMLSTVSDLSEDHPLRARLKLEKPTEEQNRLDAELIGNCVQQIVDTGSLAGVTGSFKNLPAWIQRYLQFYQCDFSSYTVDAKFGDNCFYDQVKSKDRINGPPSFNPPFFADPDAKGDKSRHLIPMVAGIGKSKRMTFRLAVHEKHAIALLSAFSEAAFPTTMAKDAFSYMQLLRSNLVEERARMVARAKKRPPVDFRALFGAKVRPKPADILKQMKGVEPPVPHDRVIEHFDNDGVFIRKFIPIPDGKTPRQDLESSELWKISEKVVKDQVTPWVLPSTFVLKGIPTNLTNAGVELLHCSGIIYEKDTPMAPSTKEHSESAQLATRLNATIQKRIKEGFGTEKWLGIVRATIETKGGKTYENRQQLAAKLREMEARRTGKSPDLSTAELLRDILRTAGRPMFSATSLTPCLKYWVHQSNGDKALPPDVEKQVRTLYEKTLKGLGKQTWFERRIVLDTLRKKREKRDHTIYDGSDRGLEAGNRYNVADKGAKSKMGSSEAAGYDGHTFKTNEVLLLPDNYERIFGIYCNDFSAESQIHALNLALELHVQTGRQFGLYLYSADTGMMRVEASTVVGWILARLGKGEKIKGETPKAAKGAKAASSAPGKVAGPSKDEAREVIETMLKSQLLFFPPASPAKAR
jgi:hypothetical protein